jgi:hypothetical protein
MTLPSTELPLVSIALCTYNGERHLREQMDSLLQQDWPNLEIVAVDDGSTDATNAILGDYTRVDTRLRHLRNEVNLGYRRNFEHAMSQCRGRWIAPCDQDDIWLPHKISALAAELQRPGTTMAYCDSELVDDDGRSLNLRLSDCLRLMSTDDPLTLLMANMVSGHAMLFERGVLEAAQPFPQAMFHDWWLASAAASTGRVAFVDECLVQYRQHAHNVTDILGRRSGERDQGCGFRARELARVGDRLKLFTRLPGRHQPTLLRLNELWQAAERQLLTPRLAAFVMRHRNSLYAASRDTPYVKLRRALSHFWGLKLKRLVEPHRYDNKH